MYPIMDGLNYLSILQNDSTNLQSTGYTIYAGDTTADDFTKDVSFFASLLNTTQNTVNNLQEIIPITITSVTPTLDTTNNATIVTCVTAVSVPTGITSGTIAGVTPDDYNWPNMTLDFTNFSDRKGFVYTILNDQITVAGSASSDNGMFIFPQINPLTLSVFKEQSK